METAVSTTVTVDVVAEAVDRKQSQALLTRASSDEHCETIVAAGSAVERVTTRFWNTVVAARALLCFVLVIGQKRKGGKK